MAQQPCQLLYVFGHLLVIHAVGMIAVSVVAQVHGYNLERLRQLACDAVPVAVGTEQAMQDVERAAFTQALVM